MDYCEDMEMDMMSSRHDGDHPASYLYEYDRGKRSAVRFSSGKTNAGNMQTLWQQPFKMAVHGARLENF